MVQLQTVGWNTHEQHGYLFSFMLKSASNLGQHFIQLLSLL